MDAGRSSRWWTRLYVGLVMLILLGLANAVTPYAMANHRVAGGWHQTKMHSALCHIT